MLVRPQTLSTPVALSARVSTDRQAQAQTGASPVTVLRERAAADGLAIAPEQEDVDDGYRGATVARPAVERLRDVVALGGVEALQGHSPDRLARAQVHQSVLLEEFARAGVRVVFLNHARRQTPEDELLLHVQGVIAAYERATIIARARRGRRHAARLGSVSALACAPYGQRYVGAGPAGDPARDAVALDEARVVRQIFAGVGWDRLPLAAVARRLSALGTPTPSGQARWNRRTVVLLRPNPAYQGEAAYGPHPPGPLAPCDRAAAVTWPQPAPPPRGDARAGPR